MPSYRHKACMDELPALLVDAVGDTTAIEIIDIGGGDVIAVTPHETYLYRSDGLLSDESLETYPHEVERITDKEGRRKHSITLYEMNAEHSFTIPARSAATVIEALLEGILRTTDVITADETVQTQFRFSELTLVVTDAQLLKHIGSAIWNDDFEAYPYADLTNLDFEEGNIATQVVVGVDDRQHRIKVPNEHAGRVREEIQSAVFEYHSVSSLGGLRAKITPDDHDTNTDTDTETDTDDDAHATADADTPEDTAGDTSESEAATGADTPEETPTEAGETDDGFVSAEWSPPADQDITRTTDTADDGEPPDEPASSHATDADLKAIEDQLAALTDHIEHQTELLETHHNTLEQLVDELRRGR